MMILSTATGQFTQKQQNCPTGFLMNEGYEKRISGDFRNVPSIRSLTADLPEMNLRQKKRFCVFSKYERTAFATDQVDDWFCESRTSLHTTGTQRTADPLFLLPSHHRNRISGTPDELWQWVSQSRCHSSPFKSPIKQKSFPLQERMRTDHSEQRSSLNLCFSLCNLRRWLRIYRHHHGSPCAEN